MSLFPGVIVPFTPILDGYNSYSQYILPWNNVPYKQDAEPFYLRNEQRIQNTLLLAAPFNYNAQPLWWYAPIVSPPTTLGKKTSIGNENNSILPSAERIYKGRVVDNTFTPTVDGLVLNYQISGTNVFNTGLAPSADSWLVLGITIPALPKFQNSAIVQRNIGYSGTPTPSPVDLCTPCTTGAIGIIPALSVSVTVYGDNGCPTSGTGEYSVPTPYALPLSCVLQCPQCPSTVPVPTDGNVYYYLANNVLYLLLDISDSTVTSIKKVEYSVDVNILETSIVPVADAYANIVRPFVPIY